MHLRIHLASLLLVVLMTTLVHGVAFAERGGAYEADVVKVRRLLESRQFPTLTALLAKYQTSCERDIRWEFAVHDGFLVFAVTKQSYKALLDDWVRRAPKSWVPLVARATYYDALGWKARGEEWAKDTSEEQFRRMGENFTLAVRDLEAALRIKPRQFFAYITLMGINQSAGDQEKGVFLVRKALEIAPDSYLVRRRHMLALVPRWGGSYDAMERFAREAAPHVGKNPLLKTLPGFVPWDQASMAELNGDSRKAIALYEKALTYGENWNFLSDLAECYYRLEMYDKALRTNERAIALRPNIARGYGIRSKICFAQKKYDDALKDIEKMERDCGYGSDEAVEIREWESNRLVSDGHALFKKDPSGAIDKYTLALRFYPKNAYAYCWRGIGYDRTGKPEAALADLRQAINLNPRMYSAYKGLDVLLIKQKRLDEIIEAWTRFIQLEPGNDNAYLERSGTYYHKKDMASAIRDLNRACELGNTRACQQLKSLPNGGRR